jgi:hypothetical protein
MAEIVQSLFGITPDMYQQSQQAMADKQALQYAQLTPFQQANFAISRGANMLGGAIGRGLGGEDPELARITARQQISKQINYADPASIARGVEMLSAAGDTQGAMMLADVGRKAESEKALATQRLAQANREAKQSIPNEIQIANEIASLETSLLNVENLPDSPDRTNAKNLLNSRLAALRGLTSKEKPESKTEIQKLQEYAATLPAGSPLLAQVQAAIKAKGEGKGTTITNVMPGDKALVDIPAFRNKVQDTIKPQSQAVFAADNALENIQNSIDTGNFASYRAAQTQFAKAIAGAGDLSQKELKAAGADPALLGGTADYLATLFTSTPTLDTQNKIKTTLQAIRKVSSDKARAEIDAQRKIAYSTPGYDRARVDEALNFPEFSAQQTGVSGDLASQAAKILADRQKAKK